MELSIDQLCKKGVAAEGLHLAGFGLTFKLGIDDFRKSSGLRITEILAERFEGKVMVVELNLKDLRA